MTTNPQSEVKCCDKQLCVHYGNPLLVDGSKCDCSCHKESPVSQSVEGWEIQYSEIADRMFREFTDEVWRQKVAPYLREIKSLQSTTLSTLVKEMEGEKIPIFKSVKCVKSFDIGCTTGSVFSKEKTGRWKGGVFSLSEESVQENLKMGLMVPLGTDGKEIEHHDSEYDIPSFNAGISAAIEVVKKMV